MHHRREIGWGLTSYRKSCGMKADSCLSQFKFTVDLHVRLSTLKRLWYDTNDIRRIHASFVENRRSVF